MPTVRDFFAREAGDYLDRLDRVVEGLDDGALPAVELHRVARALRGSAQMAREDAFARVSAALEGVGRSLSQTPAAWSPDIAGRVRETVSALRALLQTAAEEADPVADAAVANLSGMESVPAASAPAPRMDPAIAFREYAARESAGVLGYVEAALKALAVNPRDREPLKAVLRRQRALMGAARLPSIPVLAETLTAIDEVTRLVARLDVAVEGEWLDVYRGAREVLAPLVKSLQQGVDVAVPPALLTLRGIRQQLADRYGSEEPLRQPPVLTPQDAGAPGESVSVEGPAHAPAAPVAAAAPARPAAPAAPAQARPAPRSPAPARAPAPAAAPKAAAPPAQAARPAGAEPASIQDYLFRGDRALARALELRPAVERALAAGDAEAKALLAELFDLIELGRA